jgi:hypothetical protein
MVAGVDVEENVDSTGTPSGIPDQSALRAVDDAPNIHDDWILLHEKQYVLPPPHDFEMANTIHLEQ